MKDCSSSEMRKEIVDLLIEWTTIAFSKLDPSPSLSPYDYVENVLYATIIEYLDEKILSSDANQLPYIIYPPNITQDGPLYSPPQVDWLRSKCTQLGIIFDTALTYVGQPLRNIAPLVQEPVLKDGDCYFRAISSILTGTQDHHKRIRAEICRYIVVQGASFMSRYLETKFMYSSVAKYLMKSQMDGNTVWATDIEIFATSAMLGVDIFVSNDHSGYLKCNQSGKVIKMKPDESHQ